MEDSIIIKIIKKLYETGASKNGKKLSNGHLNKLETDGWITAAEKSYIKGE